MGQGGQPEANDFRQVHLRCDGKTVKRLFDPIVFQTRVTGPVKGCNTALAQKDAVKS